MESKSKIRPLKFLFILPIILVSLGANAQLSFPQDIYQVNQDVIVNGTDNVQLVENGIPIGGLSTQIDLGTKSINLGQNPSPGIYPVTFYFADQTKASYLIEITDGVINIDNSVILSVASPVPSEKTFLFTAIYNFFSREKFDVTQKVLLNGAQNFCVNNGVSVLKNVTFCFAAGNADLSVEILNTMCIDMTKDNLKALTLEVYTELFKTMHDKGYINDQQYRDLKVDDYVNLASMLNKDCSAFFDFIASKIDNADLKLAIQYQGQLCSSAVGIIKLYNKLP